MSFWSSGAMFHLPSQMGRGNSLGFFFLLLLTLTAVTFCYGVWLQLLSVQNTILLVFDRLEVMIESQCYPH